MHCGSTRCSFPTGDTGTHIDPFKASSSGSCSAPRVELRVHHHCYKHCRRTKTTTTSVI
ncbi:hypothetical protein BDQ17DRAFT_132010 [Cyathus striatus]|nr:hypothetical protein BDQ17DRAFT_132010 [Cyathus striatus]